MAQDIVKQIITAEPFDGDLVIENISKTSFEKVSEILNTQHPENHRRILYNSLTSKIRVVMPSAPHEAGISFAIATWADWINTMGISPLQMTQYIASPPSETYSGFTPPHSSSSKEPDLAQVPIGRRFPSVVWEIAYSQTTSSLDAACAIWKDGTSGQTQVVISIDLVKSGSIISGELRIWKRSTLSTRNIKLFPTESNTTRTGINASIRVDELFAGTPLPARLSGSQELTIDIATCRGVLSAAIQRIGLRCA